MKKLLLIPLLASTVLSAQQVPAAYLSDAVVKESTSEVVSAHGPVMGQADFAETINAADLKIHLMTIAGDEYMGRETGKEGQKMAARYISEHFKKLGIEGPVKGAKNSYYQQVPLQEGGWNESPTIEIDDMEFTFLDDFYAWPEQEGMKLNADEIVFLGYGIEDEKYNDYKGVDVKGKVIVLMQGEPQKDGKYLLSGTEERSNWSKDRNYKFGTAKKKGAKAIMSIDKDLKENMGRWGHYLKQRSMKLQTEESEEFPPYVYISPEMADKILNSKKLAKSKKKIAKKMKAKSFSESKSIAFNVGKDVETFNSENVLGYMEGTDLKDELIVVTSHYDHLGAEDGDRRIYNGADDDGSGTVAVLEIAEAFAKAKAAGYGPRRSILFMTVTAEEKGLLGSAHYSDNPVFPLENTVANLNIDMVGRIDKDHDNGDYVYIIGSNMLSTELHAINEQMNKEFTNILLDYEYNDKDDPNRFYYRSDHYNFAKHNIPIIFYFNGTHEDYHKPTDTPDKIAYNALQNRARLVFHTAWKLANQDKRIEVDVIQEAE